MIAYPEDLYKGLSKKEPRTTLEVYALMLSPGSERKVRTGLKRLRAHGLIRGKKITHGSNKYAFRWVWWLRGR